MRLLQLLPFMNVAANTTATLSLPLGDTYERLLLELGGTTFTKAMLTGIRVRVNAKVVHECTGAQLDLINSYCGLAADAKFLALDFSEIFARDQVGQSIGALGTASGVQNVTIEIDIGAATAPTLKAHALVSGAKAIDVLNKMLRYPFNIGATGKTPITLPYGQNGSLIKRVYIFSANMTALEVKKNGITIHDTTKLVNEFWQKENRKTPQAGLWVFDPIVDNNMGDVLNTADAQTFEFNVTLSAPEAITVLVEYIDVLQNL